MPEAKANEARFYFQAAAGNFSVLDFEGVDEISKPYHFTIRLKAEDAATDPAALVKKRARLMMLTREKKECYFNGIVGEAALEGRAEVKDAAENYAIYSVELFPLFWLLNFRRQSRLFQKMSVPDIVSDVLKKGGMAGADFKMSLSGSYPPREYCMQYRETDLEFVSRLLSEEGIFYFFKQESDREVMVFGDDISAHPSCAPDSEVKYHARAGHLSSGEEEETLSECSMTVGVQSGRVTVNDYNYDKPDMQLRFASAAREHGELEVYDHPAGHREPGHGEALAKAKRDAAFERARVIKGRGIFRSLNAGHKLKIFNHPDAAFNKLIVLLSATHRGRQPQAIETGGEGMVYESSFTAVPAEVAIRPPELIPKPRISIQTALVVGPSGQEIYTDEHGRVKIQFYWDREGKKDENSSCWIRVSQPSAGMSWGALDIPRIGHEVLVDFVEGDPDEPIVVGRVYNGRNRAPYHVTDTSAKSTVKSQTIGGGGFNELRFDDTRSLEEIYLQAQKDWNTLVKNNRSATIGANDTLTVGANRTKMVGANETNTIGMNRTSTVAAGNDVLSIGSNRVKNIGGTETVTIQGGSGSDDSKEEDPGKAIAKGAAVGAAFGMGIMGGIGALAGAAAGAAVAAFKEATSDKGSVSRKVTIVKGDDVLLLQEGSREATLVQGDDNTRLVDGSRTVNVDQGNSTAKSPNGMNMIDSKDIKLLATNSIVLQCGMGSISIDAAGNIQISGPQISINGTALTDIKAPLVKINS
jgi:type VI secretion system secreted protein VgrG